MEFSVSPLYSDVQFVLSKTKHKAIYSYDAQIRLVSGELINPVAISAIDTLCDYQENFAPVIQLTLALPSGIFTKLIYPNREKLEIILSAPNVKDDIDSFRVYQEYRAILITNNHGTIDNPTGEDTSAFTMDVMDIREATFQLIDVRIDQLRTVLVGGVFHKVKMQDLIQTTLTKALKQLELDEIKIPLGINFEGKANDRVFPQIVIPHGLNALDLPDYLQNKAGGVFSSGLSHFIDYKNWYIFPTFDVERFEEVEDTYLEIILVPQNRFDILDKTFYKNGDQLFILAGGNRELDTLPERVNQDHGEGTRFMDARVLTEGLVDTNPTNKAIISRGKNVNEYQTEESKSGYSKAGSSNTAITSNQFKEMSKLASMKGSYLTILWNYANPDLLRPGMMAKIKYMDGPSLKILDGVLLGTNTTTQPTTRNISNKTFANICALKFFVRRTLKS